jgi:hypothetical protein
MSVCPSDPVTDAHLALDDFQNFSLARQGPTCGESMTTKSPGLAGMVAWMIDRLP